MIDLYCHPMLHDVDQLLDIVFVIVEVGSLVDKVAKSAQFLCELIERWEFFWELES